MTRRMARTRPRSLRPGRSPRARIISIPREYAKALRHLFLMEMPHFNEVVPDDNVLVVEYPFQHRLFVFLVDTRENLLGLAFSKCPKYDPDSYYFSEEERPALWEIVRDVWPVRGEHLEGSMQEIADGIAKQLCIGGARD